MTDKDKEEIRQIVAEEIAKRFPIYIQQNPICLHEWRFTMGGAFCLKCGMVSNISAPPIFSLTTGRAGEK